MVDDFLAQTFTISNHPVRRLSKSMRRQYVAALGTILCYTTRGNTKAMFVFETWISSISTSESPLSTTILDTTDLKKTINLEDEIKFTSQHLRNLLFDCFYLQEKAEICKKKELYDDLCMMIYNEISRDSLNYVYEYFNAHNNGSKLSVNLRRHRDSHFVFCHQKMKRVLVVATMSAGKSTLINAMVGEKVNRVKATVCTSKAHYIYNAPCQKGASVKLDGELKYTEDISVMQSDSVDSLAIGFNSLLLKDSRICIIDTPGANYSADDTHEEITKRLISKNNYDLLVFVFNALQLGIDGERSFLKFVMKRCKKKMIFVLNQCDRYNEEDDSIYEAIKYVREMVSEFSLKEYPIIPVSGMAAYQIRQAKYHSLDRHATFLYNQWVELFNSPYYNFQSYVANATSTSECIELIDKTGITYLEKTILL